ncbi:hypothetical protein [Acinetobacter baumannii]|uniref:hypothetical protein n=3 Tax=Acinetobacter baumannii TaxID=470 RepID=UPI001FF17A79|nr:hypothetical protein [Acinetobacter baumannii]MCJ9138036.1 hypothetical protein [Acinetobacter baumannii]MCJ9280917.1 hypothetical protein [Acinetobacter baumannii]MCJ9452462.1 hypothetical protein [Acinetobacter baumannii]
MKPEQFIREYGAEKAREEFEKKLKCQDLLSELTFCEKTSSYEGDILPTNLATINGAYWAWVKRQAEMDEQQAKVEELKASHHGEVIGHEVHFKKIKQERDELQTLYIQQGINMLKLQKRVDALELKIKEIANIAMRARRGEYQTESGRNAGLNIAAQIERALKGDQYDEHRKKAEEAISKGASLTNHRIEL